MTFINSLLNTFKTKNQKDTEESQTIPTREIVTDGKTVYFTNGKMYKVFPTDQESWYDAKYLVSDGVLYDLENIERFQISILGIVLKGMGLPVLLIM